MATQAIPHKRKKIYIYIGRFQPFHWAHAHVTKRASDLADHVLVLIGSAFKASDIKNPFSYDERHGMITKWCESADVYNVLIAPVADQPYNNAKWQQTVQERVTDACKILDLREEDCDIYVTGSDRDDSTWYLKSFPQWHTDLVPAVPKGQDLNATGLRKKLFESTFEELQGQWADVPTTTEAWLHEWIHTHDMARLKKQYKIIQDGKHAWFGSPYEVIFQTVDAVVIQSGHVLLVERGSEPGKGLWALPGGFLNPGEWLIDGAIRELEEETKIKVATNVIKGSYRCREIFDDPARSLRGRTITTAHLFRLDDSKPLPKVKGSDDAVKAFWVPINKARAHPELWFEDHHAIVDWAVSLKDKS